MRLALSEKSVMDTDTNLSSYCFIRNLFVLRACTQPQYSTALARAEVVTEEAGDRAQDIAIYRENVRKFTTRALKIL